MIPLEKQVCSLELAFRMQELGFKQESLWFYNSETMKLQKGFTAHTDKNGIHHWSISAYTVSELGEMLPQGVYSYVQQSSAQKYGKWIVKWWKIKEMYQILADTEANARAKMLVYLKEHNIMGE